jgi:hypothetical protein
MTDDPAPYSRRRELIEMIGRQKGADGRELTCGIYLTQTGYEVRAEYSDGEVVRTQWAMDTQGGRIIATRWADELGLERLQQGEGGKGEGGRAGPS